MEEQLKQPIQWDYGDQLEDFNKKEQEEWSHEVQNNPIYQLYTNLIQTL